MILTLVISVRPIDSFRWPACVTNPPTQTDVCPIWIYLFTSLPVDLFTIPFTFKSYYNPLSEKSSLRENKRSALSSVLTSKSTVETLLFTVLFRVIIRCTIYGTSDTEFWHWCRYLRIGRSARSTLDSLSESQETSGAINTIFRNSLRVEGFFLLKEPGICLRDCGSQLVSDTTRDAPSFFNNHQIWPPIYAQFPSPMVIPIVNWIRTVSWGYRIHWLHLCRKVRLPQRLS